MIFFWTMFDSIMSYLTPLLISSRGFSNTAMGIIYGTSSITGAISDFIICRYFRDTKYRRLFLVMLIVCFFYPFILGAANGVWLFLLAMAVWGFYYDLFGFGQFDYVSFYVKKDEQVASFGLVQVFRSLGSIIAPIIAGFLVVGMYFFRAYVVAEVMIVIALAFYAVLVSRNSRAVVPRDPPKRKKNILKEFHLWKKIGFRIMPCLIVTFFLFDIDAIFWTLGPLYAESLGLGEFGGFFLAVYSVPILISGMMIGRVVKKRSNVMVAFLSLLVGSIILSLLAVFHGIFATMLLVGLSSLFFGFSFPSINGAYSEYIDEVPVAEGEIEALEDASFNVGYIIGPMLAGVMSDLLGLSATFSILGISGAVIAVLLLVFARKRIRLTKRMVSSVETSA